MSAQLSTNLDLAAYLKARKEANRRFAETVNRLFFAIAREARAAGFKDGKEYEAALDEMNRDLWGKNPRGRKW